MKKQLILLILFTVTVIAAYAQGPKKHFFKSDGQSVKNPDSADYYRTIEKLNTNKALYLVKDYFTDGTVMSSGYSKEKNHIAYEGIYRSFYKNGKKKQTAIYSNNLPDTLYEYYPNGNLYRYMTYLNIPKPDLRIEYIENVKDSTGKDLVVNGNGTAVLYDKDFKKVQETGNIKEGLRDGFWTGSYDNITFEETYQDGKLSSGKSTDDQNNTIQYKELLIQPSLKNGISEFYKFIARNVRYPVSAYKSDIQGVVNLRYLVTADGAIENVIVLNNIDSRLSDEAIRVLGRAPKLQPALLRGRPVKTYVNMPVSFSIHN